MTTKTKAKSRLLEAVNETASDLHRLGFINKRKMQKYDALCLKPVQGYRRSGEANKKPPEFLHVPYNPRKLRYNHV